MRAFVPAFMIVCVLALDGLSGAAAEHPGAAPVTNAPAHPSAATPWVCLLNVDGSINPAVAAFIEHGIGTGNLGPA